MTDYRVKLEPGKYELKGGEISARIKRGKESYDFFAIAYGIFLTATIGMIAEIPDHFIPWVVKILFIPLVAIILFNIFRFKAVRNFLVNIYSHIRDYEEHY